MFHTVIFLGVIGFLVAYLVDIWRFRKYKALDQLFGGPKGLPFVGLMFHLDPNKFVYQWPELIRGKAMKSVFVRFGPFPTLYTQNPEIIEKIYLSPDCNIKAEMYHMLDREMGSGLVTIGGPDWYVHRKSINPSFNIRMLLSFFPMFNEKSDAFLRELGSYVGNGALELKIPVQNLSLNTTFSTLLGRNFPEGDVTSIKLKEHINRWWELLLDRILTPHWRFDGLYKFAKPYEAYNESKSHVLKYVREMLCDRVTAKKLEAPDPVKQEEAEEIRKGNIFIDQLIDAYHRETLSWDEVMVEIITMIFAGFETTAKTIHSIFMYLAMHPEYQEKLFEEVSTVFPNKDFVVEYEDLKNLTYMEMVINETLRLAATIPIIGRVVTKDIPVSDQLTIPSGTTVLMDLFSLNRREDIWGPNAKTFNPNNFLPENMQEKQTYSFTPFAKGYRNCIGFRYANLFLKTFLSKVVRNYYFTTDFKYEDLKYVACITLNLAKYPKIEVHRR